MVRTAVGYCGGAEAQPSYRAVCSDPLYDDYAEAVHIDFDPTVISYEKILEAFFRMHDATACGRSRQYASIIFTHGDAQAQAAQVALAAQHRAATSVEAATPFWDAEAYHQKWLLQRKRPLMLALGMTEAAELWDKPATVLNAVAAGKLPGRLAMQRLNDLLEKGELSPTAHGAVAALLDPF